jgi:thioredoxin 1
MKGNFNKIIQGPKPVLVDFSAEWCGPCKMQAPILKELSAVIKDKVRIIKIDIDKNSEIANRYQIRSVPTLVFFKEGKLVWKESGVRTKAQLLELIGP